MRILVTGGAASGKSSYAEKLLLSMSGPHYYIATMRNDNSESERKVSSHRKRREGTDIILIEKDTDIGNADISSGTVLLECLATLYANEMFDNSGNYRNVMDKVEKDILALSEKADNIIIVANEVGKGFDSDYSEGTKEYIKELGRLEHSLSQRFDKIIYMTCGIPMTIKG